MYYITHNTTLNDNVFSDSNLSKRHLLALLVVSVEKKHEMDQEHQLWMDWFRRWCHWCFLRLQKSEVGLWNNFCLLGASFKKFCDYIHLRSQFVNVIIVFGKWQTKNCGISFGNISIQKYCSCFPHRFFGHNLHCQWMHDGNPSECFFCEEIGAIAISTIFKGSFKICE